MAHSLNRPSFRRVCSALWDMVRDHKSAFLSGFLFRCIAFSVLPHFMFRLTGSALDATANGDRGKFYVCVIWLFFVGIGRSLVMFVDHWFSLNLTVHCSNRIRLQAANAFVGRDTRQDDIKLLSRIEDDLPQITKFLFELPFAVSQAIFAASAAIYLYTISPNLALAIVIPFSVAFFLGSVDGEQAKNRGVAASKTSEVISSYIYQLFLSAEFLKTGPRRESMVSELRLLGLDRDRAHCRNGVFAALHLGVSKILMTFGLCTIMVVAASNLREGIMSIGTFAMCMLFAVRVCTASVSACTVVPNWHRAKGAIARILEFTGPDQAEVRRKSNECEPLEPQVLQVMGVFPHPDDIGAAVSFSAMPGQVVALLGPTSSGNSSLLAKIAGKLPVRTGLILYGTANWNQEGIFPAPLCSYLPHNSNLLCVTVEENIILGRPASPHRYAHAIKLACLDRREGTETILLDREIVNNTCVSGGQKQRICLARTFYAPRPVVLLDHPTAGLDRSTETRFWEGILANPINTYVIATDSPLGAQYAHVSIHLKLPNSE